MAYNARTSPSTAVRRRRHRPDGTYRRTSLRGSSQVASGYVGRRIGVGVSVILTLVFAVAAFVAPESLITKVLWASLWSATIWFMTRNFRRVGLSTGPTPRGAMRRH